VRASVMCLLKLDHACGLEMDDIFNVRELSIVNLFMTANHFTDFGM